MELRNSDSSLPSNCLYVEGQKMPIILQAEESWKCWSPRLFLPREENFWSSGPRRHKSSSSRVCCFRLAFNEHASKQDWSGENPSWVRLTAPIPEMHMPVSCAVTEKEKGELNGRSFVRLEGSSGQRNLLLQKHLRVRDKQPHSLYRF